MAYRAEIEIGVKGVEALTKLQKRLEGTNFKIDEINKKQSTTFGGLAQSIQNYAQQLNLAEKALSKVAAATPQETRAVNNYVTALGNANAARERQNRLIKQEIANRTGATAALKAYNAAAAAPTQRGAATTMSGAYMRGAFRGGSQYPGPIGPGAASAARLSSNLEQGRLSQRAKGLNQYERPIFPQPDINREIARRSKLRSIARATAKIEQQRSKRLAGQNSLTSGLLRLNNAVLNAARSEAQARGESVAKQRALNRELAKSQQYSRPIGPQPQRAAAVRGRAGAGQLAGRLGAAAAAAAAIRGVANLANASARTSAELSKLGIALEGVLGKNAAEGFKAIDRAARDFNQPIVDATRNFTQLSAAAVTNGNSIKQTETLYRALSAATKATGGDAQDLNGVLRAATQVISKGVVRSEELRGQIGDRLPGAFQLFAQATNRSAEELQKALEQGEVSADEFVTTFADFILNKYEPAAKKIGDSPAEAGARLTKALEDANRAAGPLLAAIGAKFQNFATNVIKFLTPLASYLTDLFNFTPATTAGYKKIGADLVTVSNKLTDAQKRLDEATDTTAKNSLKLLVDELKSKRQKLASEFSRIALALPSRTTEPPVLKKTTTDEDLKGAPRAPRLPTSEGFQLQQQISQELLKQFDIKTKYMQINMSELEALDFQNTRLRERLQREENLLEFQRQQALATSKYAADAELINELFDTRLVTLRGQTEAQIQQNAAIKEQLAIQEKITELKRQEELEGLERGLRRDIADVERRTASPFGGDEAERADLLIKQTRRYEDVINGLTALIKEQEELETSKYKKVREAATKEIAQLKQKIALNEILLPVLDQVEQAELRQNQLMEKYGFIANEAATAMSSAVQSIVTGTGSVEQAFSDMFANIGKAFIDMATQMIAQALVMKALGILNSAFGGGASDGDGGNIFTDILSRGGLRANGGPVSANTPYVVGEKGPELFIPGASGSITDNQQFEAARASMSFYGGGSGTPAYSPNIQATTMPDGMQYVTVEQMNSTVKAGMKVAANQGAAGGNALTMNKLRNSRSQRSKIGLGR